MVLLLAVYTGSSTRAVVCAVFGPSAVKKQPFILQNLTVFGRRRDFIALPRSVRHAITINTRVARGLVRVLARRNFCGEADEAAAGAEVFR